jgi:Tol biopolymer transport system component
MSEFTDLLERARERFPAPELPVDRVVVRRERQVRNQRIAAGVLALALVVAGVSAAVSVARDADRITPGGGILLPPGEGASCNALSPADPCWDTDVFVTSTDGSGVTTRLGYDEGRDLAFSWSPDGARIAFLHAVESTQDADIYTMATDGSDVRRLTDKPGIDAFPTYSPDGTRIAFQSDRGGQADVYVMDADGSNVVRLTDFDNDPRDDYVPTWAPGGRRIAFLRGEVPPGGPGELWVIDADGSNGHVLLDRPLVDFPSWSPDGTRVAFETGQWPNVRVGIFDVGTRTITEVGAGFHPVWSPDSTRLVVSMPGGSGGFAILGLEDPSRRTVLRTTGWAAAWSPDGELIVFNDAGLTASRR